MDELRQLVEALIILASGIDSPAENDLFSAALATINRKGKILKLKHALKMVNNQLDEMNRIYPCPDCHIENRLSGEEFVNARRCAECIKRY